MYIWNPSAGGDGMGANLDRADSIQVVGSGAAWGFSLQSSGGTVQIAPAGTYSTKAAAVAAVTVLMERAGYTPIP